jgi:hypothetical protein
VRLVQTRLQVGHDRRVVDQREDALMREQLGEQQRAMDGYQGLAAAGHAVDQAHREVAGGRGLLGRQFEIELGGPLLLAVEKVPLELRAVVPVERAARGADGRDLGLGEVRAEQCLFDVARHRGEQPGHELGAEPGKLLARDKPGAEAGKVFAGQRPNLVGRAIRHQRQGGNAATRALRPLYKALQLREALLELRACLGGEQLGGVELREGVRHDGQRQPTFAAVLHEQVGRTPVRANRPPDHVAIVQRAQHALDLQLAAGRLLPFRDECRHA